MQLERKQTWFGLVSFTGVLLLVAGCGQEREQKIIPPPYITWTEGKLLTPSGAGAGPAPTKRPAATSTASTVPAAPILEKPAEPKKTEPAAPEKKDAPAEKKTEPATEKKEAAPEKKTEPAAKKTEPASEKKDATPPKTSEAAPPKDATVPPPAEKKPVDPPK